MYSRKFATFIIIATYPPKPSQALRASSPEGRAFPAAVYPDVKLPLERADFPRPGEDVTAGDKRGNLARRKP